MDSTTAEILLKAMLDWESEPALNQSLVDTLLTYSAQADDYGNRAGNVGGDPWQLGSVTVGTVIVDGAGRYWRSIAPGTTQSTEPNWPNLSGSAPGYATVSDGTVTWIDQGSSWGGRWVLDVGAAMGWRIKAGMAASRYAFMTDGQQFSRNQMHMMCLAMAQAYERRLASSVLVGTEARARRIDAVVGW